MDSKKIIIIIIIIAVATAGWWLFGNNTNETEPTSVPTNEEVITTELDPVIEAHIAEKSDLIVLESPQPLEYLSSPIIFEGQARGYWYFEASFPLVLTDWNGLIIAEGFATADDDWMTEEFVPFTANLNFESPYQAGDPDFMRRGTLILQKNNPSDKRELDDALELPVYFE